MSDKQAKESRSISWAEVGLNGQERLFRQSRSKEKLEVNHIDPLVGKGYGPSCSHHQDNLVTLCHSCHVKVTASQREARKKKKS